jgi:hypothetical protein
MLARELYVVRRGLIQRTGPSPKEEEDKEEEEEEEEGEGEAVLSQKITLHQVLSSNNYQSKKSNMCPSLKQHNLYLNRF